MDQLKSIGRMQWVDMMLIKSPSLPSSFAHGAAVHLGGEVAGRPQHGPGPISLPGSRLPFDARIRTPRPHLLI